MPDAPEVTPKPEAKAEPTIAEMQARIAELQAENARLAKPPVAPPVVTPPAPAADENKTRLEAIERDLAKSRERMEIQDIATTHGLTLAQATEIHAIGKASPDLKESEKLIIAKNRKPELFNAPNPVAAGGQHSSARPSLGGGPPPVQDPIKGMIAAAKKAETRMGRDDLIKNICGAEMAKVMGLQHPAAATR